MRRAGRDLERVKALEVASAVFVAMELELVFFKGEQAVYYLRTFVRARGARPSFLNFDGRPVGGRAPRCHALSAFTGAAKPLASAAAALFAALKAKRCSALSVADAGALKKILPPGKIAERMEKGIARTRARFAEQCARASRAAADTTVKLRVDDVALSLLGADGKLVALSQGDLRLRHGALAFRFGRIKTLDEVRR